MNFMTDLEPSRQPDTRDITSRARIDHLDPRAGDATSYYCEIALTANCYGPAPGFPKHIPGLRRKPRSRRAGLVLLAQCSAARSEEDRRQRRRGNPWKPGSRTRSCLSPQGRMPGQLRPTLPSVSRMMTSVPRGMKTCPVAGSTAK